MKYLLAFITIALSAYTTRLPDEFFVNERFSPLTTTFDLITEAGSFGKIQKRFFSLTTAFELEDVNGLLIANANARFFAWGTVADVTDPSGCKIGSIEEEIFRLIPWSEYKVFNGQLLTAQGSKLVTDCFQSSHAAG